MHCKNVRLTQITLLLLFYYINKSSAQEEQNLIFCDCPATNNTNSLCICYPSYNCETGVVQDQPDINENDLAVDKIGLECKDDERCCIVPDHLLPEFPSSRNPNSGKCGTHKLIATNKIVSNDLNVVEKEEFPWLVGVLLKGDDEKYIPKCWGSLIHPQVVLTATHCLKTITNSTKVVNDERLKLIAPLKDTDSIEHPQDDTHQQRFAKEIIVHTKYIPFGLINDTSLIILNQPMKIDAAVNTICLPQSNYEIKPGKRCQVVGWEPGNHSLKFAQRIDLPLVDHQTCQTNLSKTALGTDFTLHDSFICAGGEKGRDSCFGDGGSALVCDYEKEQSVVVGMVAWGVECGKENAPGVYVNVPMFTTWIKDELNKRGMKI